MGKKKTYQRKKKREVLKDYQAGDHLDVLYKGAIIPVVYFSSIDKDDNTIFCRLVDMLGVHVYLPGNLLVQNETKLAGEKIVYDGNKSSDPLGGS